MGEQKNKHEKYFVAYIDVLGFKEMSDEYYSGKNDSLLELLQGSFEKAKRDYENFVEALKNQPALEKYDINIQLKQFSDSVIFSMSTSESEDFIVQLNTFVTIVSNYQQNLMENRIFCRGGIAYDKHYETDNFIFSQALINAYKNESEIAIYPRIVIDKNLVKEIEKKFRDIGNKFRTSEGFLPKEKYISKNLGVMIISDWDELCFINPFKDRLMKEYFSFNSEKITQQQIVNRDIFLTKHNASFEKIKKEVEKNIEKYKDSYSVLKKYLWLKEFLNWHNELPSKIIFERMTFI